MNENRLNNAVMTVPVSQHQATKDAHTGDVVKWRSRNNKIWYYEKFYLTCIKRRLHYKASETIQRTIQSHCSLINTYKRQLHATCGAYRTCLLKTYIFGYLVIDVLSTNVERIFLEHMMNLRGRQQCFSIVVTDLLIAQAI